MGAVVAYCMNLPAEIAFAPENCFFITATPGPKEPDVITLNHCLRPFIDEIEPFQKSGQQIPTYRHPDGASVRTRIGIPVIADTPALHKVLGHLSHSAFKFCSFCDLLIELIETLNHNDWNLRNGTTTRAQALKWKQLTTKDARRDYAKETGIRWTELHRLDLSHWDSIQDHILGFMHIWLEGVLETHQRTLWGIGRAEKDENAQKKATEIAKDHSDEEDEHFTHADVVESASELEELRAESEALLARDLNSSSNDEEVVSHLLGK